MKKFILVVIVLLVLAGWTMNLVKLIQCDFESPYKAEVIHTAGVFIPFVGAITGWINLGE